MSVSVPELECLLAAATERPWEFSEGKWAKEWRFSTPRPPDQPNLMSIHNEAGPIIESWASYAEDTGVAVRDDDAALIVAAVNALPALLAAAKALREIAESYGWEAYRDGEVVTPWLWDESEPQPTNRRIAREALAGLSFEEPQA